MEFESALGLEMDMARKLHSTIWAAVRSARVLATFVVGMGVFVVVLFVAGDGVNAFDAETLHFVDGAFGAGFDFVDVVEDLCEEAAEDVFAFGVGGVGGWGEESYGVEG